MLALLQSPVSFLTIKLTCLRWPWDLSACSGVSSTIPDCPRELCSCLHDYLCMKAGINYVFNPPPPQNKQTKSTGQVVWRVKGNEQPGELLFPSECRKPHCEILWVMENGKDNLKLQLVLVKMLSVPLSPRMCARRLACHSPEPPQY